MVPPHPWLIDEYTQECLAIRVARRPRSQEVIETLAEVMVWRGIPEHLRSDYGPDFIAQELQSWLGSLPWIRKESWINRRER